VSRDDEELFARFDDTVNDASLFIGWWDYQAAAQGKLPVAAQVFQVWYYADYEEKLAPDADLARIREAFPDIRIVRVPIQDASDSRVSRIYDSGY
jgi:hypothetical protein